MTQEMYCIFSDPENRPNTLAKKRVYSDIKVAMHDLALMQRTGKFKKAGVAPLCVVGTAVEHGYRMVGSRFNPEHMLKNYGTVRIGRNVWTARNLIAPTKGAAGIFFNEATVENYFTWEAAVKETEKYPGWHIPTREEWLEMLECCGGASLAAQKLKSRYDWPGDSNGTDSYRFSVAPAGFWDHGFRGAGIDAHFWAAGDGSTVYYFKFDTTGNVKEYSTSGNCGAAFSLRLVQDRD